MSGARGYLGATMAIVRRDALIYLSYRSRVVTQNLAVVFSLALYYYLAKLVHVPSFGSPADYFAYVTVGVAIVLVLHSSFEVPNLVRTELLMGTFERLVVSPFGPLGTILALMWFPLLMSLLTGAFTVLLAAAVFGLRIRWATLPLALPVAVLGALSFSGFSVALAAVMLRFKQVPGATYVLAAIGIVSGIYFPPSVLPSWLRWTSEVQPFTPAVDLLRNVVVGLPLKESALLELARLLGFVLLGLPLAAWLLAWSIQGSRRRGTITEF